MVRRVPYIAHRFAVRASVPSLDVRSSVYRMGVDAVSYLGCCTPCIMHRVPSRCQGCPMHDAHGAMRYAHGARCGGRGRTVRPTGCPTMCSTCGVSCRQRRRTGGLTLTLTLSSETRLYTQCHNTTVKCSNCEPDCRVHWLMAWTNGSCVLGMLAIGVDSVLPPSSERSPP